MIEVDTTIMGDYGWCSLIKSSGIYAMPESTSDTKLDFIMVVEVNEIVTRREVKLRSSTSVAITGYYLWMQLSMNLGLLSFFADDGGDGR